MRRGGGMRRERRREEGKWRLWRKRRGWRVRGRGEEG